MELFYLLSGALSLYAVNVVTANGNALTKRTYGQPSGHLFPKKWSLSNPNRTENDINKHKVKRYRKSYNKNMQQRATTELPPWNGQ